VFDPREDSVGLLVDEEDWDRLFFEYFTFLLSISFHHCSAHVFIYVPLTLYSVRYWVRRQVEH
jgi:hypothetical protein